MLSNNFVFYSIKILTQIFWEIVYFPVWWYTIGLFHLLQTLQEFMSNREKELALLVWVKNIFKPMYGEYNWQGWIISFIVRLFQIIVRSVVLLFWFIIVVAVLLLWIILPVAAVLQIIRQVLF
jgi:hypothetical protein